MSERIVINEVGPRDGLQSQDKHLSTEERIVLIRALLAARLGHIEVGSFVSPKAVPQMANTDAVLQAVQGETAARLSVLVPNRRGYDLALAAGAQTVAVVVSATETMNRKNINMGLDDVLAVAAELIAQGKSDGVTVQAYLSVAWECPFEGAVSPEVVRAQALQLADADELVIADTIGAAAPHDVLSLMNALASDVGAAKLACHFHDTRALGLANVYAAVTAGIRRFDSAIGGLGGCPFAPGAKGNVATEDVVMLCEQMGFATGVDMPKLLAAVDVAKDLTGTCHGGRAHYWLSNNAA